MANTITTTYQMNGSRVFVAKVDIIGDGSGEASGVTILDPANITGNPTTIRIRKMQWGMDAGGWTARLLWDADTDVQAFEIGLPNGGIDFYQTGQPLVNNAGTGKTGKLLLTTSGLGSTSRGTIIIEGIHK